MWQYCGSLHRGTNTHAFAYHGKSLEYAKGREPDSVVTISGGSALDLGKAISIRTESPHISIPTTCAGSKITSNLGGTANGQKKTQIFPKILPGVVLFDVQLTMSLPAAMSATSSIKLLLMQLMTIPVRNKVMLTSPQLKLFMVRIRVLLTCAVAQEGVRAIAASLPGIVENLLSKSARRDALYDAWLCGSCLGIVSMSLLHKLCHTFGGAFKLPHSETHTIALPLALSYLAPNIPEALERFARSCQKAMEMLLQA